MEKKSGYRLLRLFATAGNLLFVLWLFRNGINEGFRASAFQLASYISLFLLLGLNSFLLWFKVR